MKNILLIVLTVLFAIGIGVIIVYIPSKQQQNNLEKQAVQLKTENTGLKDKVKELQTKESQQIQEQKQEVLETTKAGLAYFTHTVKDLGQNEKQIDIYLKGNTSVDAVDLVLTHKDTLKIKEIRKGTVFVSYPRLIDENGVVTITGIAMPQGNTFVYGKTGEIYATLIVTITEAKQTLDLNTKDTQAYFNATPVLDFTSSFAQIEL